MIEIWMGKHAKRIPVAKVYRNGFGLSNLALERAAGFEPATTCLGSKDSTTELRPLGHSLPESYAGNDFKSRKVTSSVFYFDERKFPSPDLQSIRVPGNESQDCVRIDLFAPIDLKTALDNQSAGFALAWN